MGKAATRAARRADCLATPASNSACRGCVMTASTKPPANSANGPCAMFAERSAVGFQPQRLYNGSKRRLVTLSADCRAVKRPLGGRDASPLPHRIAGYDRLHASCCDGRPEAWCTCMTPCHERSQSGASQKSLLPANQSECPAILKLTTSRNATMLHAYACRAGGQRV